MAAIARGLAIALLAGTTSAAGAAELVVAWAPLAVAVDGYQVERRVDDGREDWRPIARVAAEATRFTDRSVSAGVRYCYRVRGVREWRRSPPSPPLCNVASDRPPAETAPLAATSATPAPEARRDVAPVASETEPEAAPSPQPERASAAVAPAEAPAASSSASPAEPEASVTVVAVQRTEPGALRPAAADGEFREVKALRRPPPKYPPDAQIRGISGWVKLIFTVAADGTTRDIRVTAADPPGVFDAAAIEAAQRFLYAPRVENGAPVDRPNVETEITFTWIDRGGSLVTDRRSPAPR